MKLYYCAIGELMDLPGMDLITQERRARTERYHKPENRAESLAAGLLLRHALGDAAEALQRNPQGKPCLPGGPCFNLSHSGEYAILGVSRQPLGVDIERIRAYDERAARRCFTGPELDWLREEGGEKPFFRLWTAKESVMKATGLGFSMAPGGFSVLPAEDGPHEIEGRCWYLRWGSLPGHVICTASAEPEAIRWIPLSREELLD